MKNINIKTIALLAFFAAIGNQATAQTTTLKVGTNATIKDPSTVLELEATDKGVLFPRVDLQNLTDTTTIPNPVNGLTVFQVTDLNNNPFNQMVDGYYYWSADQSQWVRLHTTIDNWNLKGNAGTFPAGGLSGGTDFLGTTDAKDFQIKVGTNYPYNNIMRVKNTNGHVQFGNWRDLSVASNTQDPDVFVNSGAPTTLPANFAVQNNFETNDFSAGTIINNTRSAAYLNASSDKLFYNDMNYVNVGANGYTGSVAGSFNQIRVSSPGVLNVTNANGLTTGSQGLISIQSGATLSGGTNYGSAAVLGNYSNSGTVNNAAAAVQGLVFSVNGTFNGTFAGVQGLLNANNAFNGQAVGLQGTIKNGRFNNTTGAALIGVDADISAANSFAPNTSVYGLRSNVAASNIVNGYGLYIEDVIGSTSQRGVYQVGANDTNYFAGNTGIGTTAGVANAKLHVVKAATDLTPAIIEGCNVYADNAAATAAGLPVGGLYRTATGQLMVRF